MNSISEHISKCLLVIQQNKKTEIYQKLSLFQVKVLEGKFLR